MITDFIALNYSNIFLTTILINIYINKKNNLYYIFIIDMIINKFPFITIILIFLKYINKLVLKYINDTFITRYFLIIIYYFIFGIVLYSIYNKFNFYIIKFLINNIGLNLIYFYISLKIIKQKKDKNEI